MRKVNWCLRALLGIKRKDLAAHPIYAHGAWFWLDANEAHVFMGSMAEMGVAKYNWDGDGATAPITYEMRKADGYYAECSARTTNEFLASALENPLGIRAIHGIMPGSVAAQVLHSAQAAELAAYSEKWRKAAEKAQKEFTDGTKK